ncbi:YkgJ family cysteine cluster protein [Dehalococcoides mccartyi]|uniref:Zinc/iron-chelating domain-containing protein n=1 Tax=Dehalococcoides mccartyi (strain CBDB1) TaxID=255470 RepID=A0A916KLI6_DEHMC|nr:YkgJ family cysteine cluster protein [Dehalococcoides mccartyi]CAI82359.1 conserved hypothetical protein; probable peptidase M14, carboxypeptidase A [Dehalococcoides mccartyi CBDB1]
MKDQLISNSKSKPHINGMPYSEQTYWQLMAAEYEAHVAQIGKQQPNAASTNASKCIRCGLCCYQYPCIPRPEEIEPIAQYLELTTLDLINKYMVINTADCKVYFLRWAKHGEEDITGKMIPPARTFDRGYCVFYDQKSRSCCIHPIRPQEARVIKCWEKNNGMDKSLWGITGWNSQDILRFLPDFSPRIYADNKYLPPKSSMPPRKY